MKARMKITTKEMKRSTYEMRIGDKMVMFFSLLSIQLQSKKFGMRYFLQNLLNNKYILYDNLIHITVNFIYLF